MDSPYFDVTYFDPAYFDAGAVGAAGPEGHSGRLFRRPRRQYLAPEEREHDSEDWIVLIL